MASDQPFGLMLRFANLKKLDQWGVLPQLVAVAWIRDGYTAVAPAFGLKTAYQNLVLFMRLQALWPFVIAPLVTAAAMWIGGLFTENQSKPTRNVVAASFAAFATLRLGGLVLFLSIVAVVSGREQSVSFMRLSSFFVPLLVLLAAVSTVVVIEAKIWQHRERWVQTTLPIALAAVFLYAWKPLDHDKKPVQQLQHVLQYAIGYISLAQAYSYATGLSGAIHPATLAAAQLLPPNTPIWSTNVASYCMAPGCLIESVISFKMSNRLEDILGGSPDLAKQRLQEAGLNYFQFRKDATMLDLLPYSQLFAPDVIGKYLGIRWTDGTTYLLTWIGPDIKPLDYDFYASYNRQHAEPDKSFRFAELARQIVTLTPSLRTASDGGVAEALLKWPSVHAETNR